MVEQMGQMEKELRIIRVEKGRELQPVNLAKWGQHFILAEEEVMPVDKVRVRQLVDKGELVPQF